MNFANSIKNVRFNSSNCNLYQPLTHLLTAGNFIRPKDIAISILSLLSHDLVIKNLLVKKNFSLNLNKVISIIESLNKFPLLHHLMRLCPLPDLLFEKLFVEIRGVLLKNLNKIKTSPEMIYFLSTLSIHCFTNEYIYIESEEETFLIDDLHTKISQILAKSDQPETLKVLCLASYRPLHKYDWCQNI